MLENKQPSDPEPGHVSRKIVEDLQAKGFLAPGDRYDRNLIGRALM